MNHVILPIIQRVFAKTIGLDLVSVQPMYYESKEEKLRKLRKEKLYNLFGNSI